ncbi:MAG TPA: FtsX-like permease family protein, partial [Gemmatimonadaceae bacterium]|nr:FtsX-like permease family protein [Gemmatimonadaceae bacterium]
LGNVRRPMLVLLGAVLLVLILTTANVATLFLARWTSRAHELGVRRALGASASRETRHLMTESGVLAGLGGVLGIIISVWLVSAVRTLGGHVLPRVESITVDWCVLAFAIVTTLATGAAAGLAPAVAARRRPVTLGSTRVTTRAPGALAALVVAQVALSVMLVIGAGLLMKGFLRVLPEDPGFALDNRATVTVRLGERAAMSSDDPEGQRRFVRDVIAGMARIDGVREVAATAYLPFVRMFALSEIEVPGVPQDGRPFTAFRTTVTPNYLELMRIPVVAGRGFTAGDDGTAERVVVINQTAAARWWPRQTAVGQRVTYTRGRQRVTATVVGISRDARLSGTDTRVRPELFEPLAQGSLNMVSFVAHTDGRSRVTARDLERAVWAVKPDLPVETTTDLATLARESVGPARFYTMTMAAFAGIAVTLTGLGVYAILAFIVAARRREIGIRFALGAPRRHVGTIIVRRAFVLGAAGVVIGSLGARVLTRYIETLLLEVGPTDPTIFLGTALGVLLLAVVAALIPALSAVRVDPLTVMQVE